MKRITNKIVSLFIFLIVGLVLVACDDKSYLEEAIAQVDTVLTDAGFEHGDTLELMYKYKKVIITWESTDEDVINQDGIVNAIGLTDNVKVTIEVTFREGKKTETRKYEVTVYKIEDTPGPDPDPDPQPVDPNIAKVQLVKNSLNLPASTKTDLNLVTISNGVTLVWESSHEAITTEGKVTRSEEENITVTLKVTLTAGEVKDNKTFVVIVEKEDVLTETKNLLSIVGVASEDITLPVVGGKNDLVNITWESSHEAVISSAGKVTRSLTEDITVTLIATLTYKEQAPQTKTFEVKVLKDPTLDDAVAKVSIPANVLRDINLLTSIGEVQVTWQSSHAAITSTGVVTRGSVDVDVTLTATFVYKGIERKVLFEVVVIKEASKKLPTPVGFVNQTTFFAYAPITHDAYSGSLMATFSAPGHDTVNFINPSTQGVFNIPQALKDMLVPGVEYSVVFRALAKEDSLEWGDSDPTAPLKYTQPALPMNPMGALTKTEDGYLTWEEVSTAQYYEVYVNRALIVTIQKGEELKFLLPDAVGVHRIEVIAKAKGYTSSSAFVEHIIQSDEVVELEAPVIELNSDNNTISWKAIPHAVGYKIIVGTITKTTTGTTFDLLNITSQKGDYSVIVIAVGDALFYSDSKESNAIAYSITVEISRLTGLTQGDFVASYLLNGVDGGHRKLEIHQAHAVYQQASWTRKVKLGILVNGAMIYEVFDFGRGGMIMLHTPGSTTSFFGRNLPETATVELHIILVGDGINALDSEPLILTMNWSRS